MDFPIATDHRVKIKEREKIDKYLDLARELKKKKKKKKKKVQHVGDCDTNCWCTWENDWNRRRINAIQTHNIVEIGQNTQKSPGDPEETCCH